MQPRNPIGLFCKKERAVCTNEKDAFHLRRVWSSACDNRERIAPSFKVDLRVHSLPPKRAQGTARLYHADTFPFQLPVQWCLTHASCVALTKGPSPAVRHKATWQLIFCETQWVWVRDGAGGSAWKFAHHSLKANSVQVLGPIVPQNVGRAVRAGGTPVLYLCHLGKRKREEMKDR